MATKNELERIEALSEKIRQLEVRKKQLEVRTKEKERKERTRRLIQVGAIMDSLGISTVELADKFKNHLLIDEGSKELLSKFLSENKQSEIIKPLDNSSEM